MEEVTIAGKITLPVDNALFEFDYINWGNRAWLVAGWSKADGERVMRPVRLIAPRFAPGYRPTPGVEPLQSLGAIPELRLTKSLLEQGDVPPAQAQLIEVVERPPLFLQSGNPSGHSTH